MYALQDNSFYGIVGSLMEKKHIITIAGRPGSGKSTTANEVAKLLGYTRFSSGDLMRDIAKKRGLSIRELNTVAETDKTIDHEIDNSLKRLNELERIVIDSRLAFHWIPNSFKVYLDLDLDIAATRIFRDMNKKRVDSGEEFDSPFDVADSIRGRLISEKKRYMKLYGIDPYHPSHFDLIIDTARNDQSVVALKVYDLYKQWLASDGWKPIHESVPINYSM